MRRTTPALLTSLMFILGMLIAPSFARSQIEIPGFGKVNVNVDGKASGNVVAVFTLKGALTETPQDEMASLFGSPGTSLRELVKKMKAAADDSSVKAIVILDEGGTVGTAQLEELRQAMKQVRDAGKEIYINADSLTMGKYVLFSGASRLSVVPTGDVWVTGFFAEQPYVRGLLEKLGVTPDFLHCGAYKSASELFMRDGPSKEADEMMNWLFDGIYGDMVDLISRGRGVTADQAKGWIDAGPYTAEKAKAAGMIDAVEHREQFQDTIKAKFGADVVFERKYGEKAKEQIDFSSPFAIFKILGDMTSDATKDKGGKDAVGIVYVDGAISLGSKEPSPFGGSSGAMSSEIRKALDDAANDDSIKAVVLRVDSPGGSAVASEIILEGTMRVKAKKPLIVSMGNVAGSGGYYVTCASDTIFADESTITGSIGVVGGKFATNEMWKKVGITFKPYQRGANAALLSSAAPFSADERTRMQGYMDEIYGVFKSHVTTARGNRLKKPIDDLAGGRVYTGKQALELGLVDKLGTLQDAIAFAASKANLGAEYDVRPVPEPKNFVEALVEQLTGGGKEDNRLIRMGGATSLWDLALPHLAGLDPARFAAVKQAFTQLQLMQDEGVIMMMPPIVVSK